MCIQPRRSNTARMMFFPTISAYTRWNCLATTDASKSRSTPILTVRCSFQRVFCLSQFDAAELICYMITKPQRRQLDQTYLKLLQMLGDVHPNPGPATKYLCPVCTRNVSSRGATSAPNAMDGCTRNALES